jgi:hypothetical protein
MISELFNFWYNQGRMLIGFSHEEHRDTVRGREKKEEEHKEGRKEELSTAGFPCFLCLNVHTGISLTPLQTTMRRTG